MRSRLQKSEFRKLAKSPAIFLAYCGMRRALRHSPLMSGEQKHRGLTIFVTPPRYRTDEYRDAAEYLDRIDRNTDWVLAGNRIHAVGSGRKKSKFQKDDLSIFDLDELSIIITADLGKVPHELCFAADEILQIAPPSARHVQAARILSSKSPFTDEIAAAVAAKPQKMMIAALARRELNEGDLPELSLLGMAAAEGPSLFELPGYEREKAFARLVANDVALWRQDKLEWSEVGSGALVYGPPGTGKTQFGQAFANALGLKFVSTTVGKWQKAGHLDDTLRAMHQSFADAAAADGAVLFIDEFDSLGHRGMLHGERYQLYWQIVINEFLSLMTNLPDGVIVIGATNYRELIDPAVLRSGRIEEHFELSLPDNQTRAEILSYHLKGVIDTASLADSVANLEGMSGSDLEKVARHARRRSRAEGRAVKIEDVDAVLPARKKYSLEEQFRLAVHESGHAIVALAVGFAKSATITVRETFDPRAHSNAGGETSYELFEDWVPTENSLLDRIAVAYAGMAAEQVVFGDRSLGSGGVDGSDVERATTIARRLVASYGLGSAPIFIKDIASLKDSPLPAAIEEEVRQILGAEYQRAREMLAAEHDQILALAKDSMLHRSVRVESQNGADLPDPRPASDG